MNAARICRRTFTTSTCLCGVKSRIPIDKRFPARARHVSKNKKGGSELMAMRLAQKVVQPTGYVNKKSMKFKNVPEMIPEFVVPDLTGFELKPYVPYNATEIKQDKLTAKGLFNACYAEDIIKMYNSGKITDEDIELILEDDSPSNKYINQILTKDRQKFIVYKSPTIKDPNKPSVTIDKGVKYFYMELDKSSTTSTWETYSDISSKNKNKSPLFETLTQIYEFDTTVTPTPKNDSDNQTITYIMYNDQPPITDNKTSKWWNPSATFGHSKGVLAFDDNDGFWLIHSLPRYPFKKEEGYNWPSNGYPYGQTFLCVSYDRSMLSSIEQQLGYINPYKYDGNIDIADISSRTKPTLAPIPNPTDNKVILTSLGTIKIHHFAKSRKYNKDLYNCFVAETLKTDLKAETWRRPLASNMTVGCSSSYTVKDIMKIRFNVTASGSTSDVTEFRSSKDHSKWVVSDKTSSTKWTCIGDINREDSQKTRGGGTACIKNGYIWSAFNDIIDEDIKVICGIVPGTKRTRPPGTAVTPNPKRTLSPVAGG